MERGQSSNVHIQHDCQIINHWPGQPTGTTTSGVWDQALVWESSWSLWTRARCVLNTLSFFPSPSHLPLWSQPHTVQGPGTDHSCSLKPRSQFGTKHKTDKQSSISRFVCFTYWGGGGGEASFWSNIQKRLPCRTHRNGNPQLQCALSPILSPRFLRWEILYSWDFDPGLRTLPISSNKNKRKGEKNKEKWFSGSYRKRLYAHTYTQGNAA